MARLTTVDSPFEARLLAARLGSDGILWELRGNVDGIYPGLGVVEVLVSADQLQEASALLLVSDVDSAFDDAEMVGSGRRRRAVVLVATVLVCVAFLVVRMFALG